MKIIVTGAAGFIGSHLCEALVQSGRHDVIGVDSLVRDELSTIGTAHLDGIMDHPRFAFLQEDLGDADWDTLLRNVDAVYHLAGVPGVRDSWGASFQKYLHHNIAVTQRLLEACRGKEQLRKFVFISTSSVYGEVPGRVSEKRLPTPLSPYGVTKLTAEHLCQVYRREAGVPVVILRYFTVYGPRQRSDMAFHRFIKAILQDQPITLFGDGCQTRDFTFVSDCVAATAAVIEQPDVVGEVINVGGMERASVREVIAMMEELIGKRARIQSGGGLVGEPVHTWANIAKAKRLLGYKPRISLKKGIMEEIHYIKGLLDHHN
ncbi:NAD-dependent epimerase/dehydratase family protein [Paenibacillus chungangensis]|uniref:NAD-dependent epimerase/dehydratase family protein n=1 Tax=Paenibacillus chungangensis TaxID=696535 RepID=A0ABW3HLW1_9BACL